MAQNDLLVRLGLDSNNFDKSILQTKKSITELGSKATNELIDIADRFKKTSESPASLARKLKDIRKAMEEMTTAGYTTTAEGQAMYQKLSQAAKEYDKMLTQIQNDTRDVGKESANTNGIGIDFKSVGGDLLNKSGLGGVAPALSAISGAINPVTVGITAVGGTMIAAGKATAEFETHLNSLQALTGLTDDEMKAVNDGAIQMSKNFRSSAGEIVEAMKLIGSQAPELLKDSDALMKVTEAANVLSEAAEISVEDAAKAITGTMNQMGASASQSTDIINTFAAASQQGSADVAYLNKAFEKSGTAASSAGMDYVQLASAIEAIAPKFSSADVAGSQLASTLLKLSMSGNSDFMPSVVGMSKALENLANAEMDDVTMKKLVGESNITMLKSLIQAREQFDSYSDSLRGTNTAYEQMETNQKGFTGSVTKLKSAWEAFLLTLGQSGVMQGIMDELVKVMQVINEIINIIGDVINSFESFGEIGVSEINPVMTQLDILIVVIKGVGEVIQIVVRLVGKAFSAISDAAHGAGDYIGEQWETLKNKLKDVAFARAIINAFNKVLDAAANMCARIRKYWNKLKEFLGMKIETNVTEKVTHTGNNIPDSSAAPAPATNSSTSGKSKSGKSKKSTSAKTEKIDYLVSVDDNSLDVAEKKLSAWTTKKKTLNIDDKEAIAECDANIKKWTDEVEKRKLILDGLQVDDNSLNALKKKIKDKESEIQLLLNTDITAESLQKVQSELDALRKKEAAKEIELGIKAATPSISKSDTKFERGSIDDKKQSLSNAQSMMKEIQENYKLNFINKDEAQKEIDEVNDKLKELGLQEINIHFNDDGTLTTAAEDLERYQNQMDSVRDLTGAVGSTFGSLGNAIGRTTGEVMNFAGQSIAAIGQLIPQILTMITAKNAEAIAVGTASGASLPFPANLAAIASIVATIASVFASLPQFADGGIVGGSSFTGDRLLARVNSGEMILNKVQQQNLYNSMSNAGVGSMQNTLKGDVTFSISGAALKGTLKNYDSKMSKIK